MSFTRQITAAAALALSAASAIAATPEPLTYAAVEPILERHCAPCHSANSNLGDPPGEFIVDSYAKVISGKRRVRVVPGQPLASELLRRVRGLAEPRMPFDGPPWLSAPEVATIERWIADGARDADGRPAPFPVGRPISLGGTLSAADELDGLRFDAGSARREKQPRVGGAARVTGTLDADGLIHAERLRGL